MRIRRRMANSMTIMPTGCAGADPAAQLGGLEHAAQAGCLHLYARAFLDGQLAAVESHGGESIVLRHQLATVTAERLTTGQSLSTSASKLK